MAGGGALGALLRWGVLQHISAPIGTFAVNVIGSFLIGWAVVLMSGFSSKWQLLVIAGVLGGFTTFSAFSLDVLKLLEADRVVAAMGYALGSVVLSLAAAALGLWMAKGFMS